MRITATPEGRRRSKARIWYPSERPISRGPMNRLAGSTSPYLRQHADNPVDWWPWIPEAFADAKRRNVPVHLSIGLRRLPLVPCHGARELLRSDDRRLLNGISSPSRLTGRSGRRSTRSTCARCMRWESRGLAAPQCFLRRTATPSGAEHTSRRSRAGAVRASARYSARSPHAWDRGRYGDQEHGDAPRLPEPAYSNCRART